jgi:hypothetical protein
MGYSEARGPLTYEKNLKSKFSCQTPFKEFSWGPGFDTHQAPGSVPDPWHFVVDPDPRIHASD